MLLQHARWGDAPYRGLYDMSKNNRVHGLEFNRLPPPCACRVCDMCKNHRSPITPVAKTEDRIMYEDGLESASMDYIGPYHVRSKPGAHTGAHMLTHYGCRKGSEKEPTRFVLAYPVRRKSVAPDCIRHGHHFIKSRFGRHIRHIQFDNAKEYLGSEMKQCMRDLNWFATYSPKYTAVQNRHAEKTNHLVCSIALCMMVRAQAPLWTWAMALVYATYVYNRLGKTGGGKSPYELISGVIPDGSMLRVFWCPCSPLYFREQGRTHLDPTSRGKLMTPCRFVGLDEERENSWLYYDPQKQKIDHNAHMTFDESHYDGSQIIFGETAPEVTEGLLQEYVDGLGLTYAPDGDAAEQAAGGGESGDDDAETASPDSAPQNRNENDGDDGDEAPDAADAPPPRPDQPNDAPAQTARRSTRERRQYEQPYEPNMGNGTYMPAPEQQQQPHDTGRGSDSEELITVSEEQAREQATSATQDEVDAAQRMMDEMDESQQAMVIESIAEAIVSVEQKAALEKANRFADEMIAAVMTLAVVEQASLTGTQRPPDPQSIREAKSRDDWPKWVEAHKDELQAMIDLGVWSIVGSRKDVPKGTNILKSKGVWKVKYLDTGEIDKYKFRLVACGYSQIYGADFSEAHAGVVSMPVFRLFLGLVAALHLKTRLYDVGNAFLECDLEEELHMQLPDYLGGEVVRLHKAIYGLKQSGMLFVRTMATFLKSLGFQQSRDEPCMFTLITKVDDAPSEWKGWGYITVLTYIDDVPAASNSDSLMSWLGDALKNRFRKVTDEPLRWFLANRVTIEKGIVSMDQEQYCLYIINKFRTYLERFFSNVDGSLKTRSVPMKPGTVLSKADCPKTPAETAEMGEYPYAELCGSLLYLANGTRMDILVATSNCARFMANPGMVHWLRLLEIVLYLMNEPGRRVWYRDLGPELNCRVRFECDASFADCPDTAQSRYGVIGYSQGAFVIAKTGKMKNVRLNTFDAETGALAQAVMQALPVRRYMAAWGFPQTGPTHIGEDNNAALLCSHSWVPTKKARHIHVDVHFVREHQLETKSIYVHRVPSAENSADMMSKNVTPQLQQRRDIQGMQWERVSFRLTEQNKQQRGEANTTACAHSEGARLDHIEDG